MVPAVIVREAMWELPRAVYEVRGETVIGHLGHDIDVGPDGPLAVITWRDGWWIRPAIPSLAIDDEPLRDEHPLRHGQAIRMLGHGGWTLRFLIGDRVRALDEYRHVEMVTDKLTGLCNRRLAHRMLERMATGTVMMIDIDRLKQINDRLGMLAGDVTIRRTAAILRALVAWPALAARYGGEEFLVLLPVQLDARRLAEQIRAAAEVRVEFGAHVFEATLSIGLAPHTGDGLESVRVADEALMQAKQQGRNRVVVLTT